MTRVLIWSPNYAPELVGIPPLVTELAQWLAQSGHRVEVVTAMPNYPDRIIFPGFRGNLFDTSSVRGVMVRRSWLRVRPQESLLDKGLYEATFAAFSSPSFLRRVARCDVVLCLVPTVISAAIGAVGARLFGKRLVIWVQDLVLRAAYSLDRGSHSTGAISLVGSLVERIPLTLADQIVSCSPGFRDYLLEHGAQPGRVEVIPNWVDTDAITTSAEPAVSPVFRILYSGNIGYTQGFGTLLDSARLLGSEFAIEVVGAGNEAVHLRRHGVTNVTVRQPVPRTEYAALLATAHVHLVLQRKVAANANLPSKIGSYLASGRPIVASLAEESAATELLRRSEACLIVPPEDPAALADAFRRLRNSNSMRSRMGVAARRFAETELSARTILPNLERSLIGDRADASSGTARSPQNDLDA